MATASTHVTPAPAATERRAHQRKRLQQLAYVGFGPDTGGVLLDVSEEGLRCQIVGAVIEGDRCHLKFALPGRHSPIEVDGQVVWSNKSGQGGGVQLVGLGSDVRQELQRWVLEGVSLGDARNPAAPAAEPVQPVVDALPITAPIPVEDEHKPVQPDGTITVTSRATATKASARSAKPHQTKPQVLLTIVSEQQLNSHFSRAFLVAAGFAIGFATVALYAF